MKYDYLPCHKDLTALIKSLFDGTDVQVTLSGGSIKGLGGGGASDSNKATVRVDGGPEIKVFIKSCLDGTQGKEFDNLLDTFGKEITFYTDILPKMVKESKQDLGGLVAECYGAGRTENGDVSLVLEDFASKGFSVVPKEEYMTHENVKRSMEGLAKFHALSMGKPELLKDHLETLKDRPYFKEAEPPLFPWFCQPMLDHSKLLLAVMRQRAVNGFDKVKIPDSVTEELLERMVTVSPQNLVICKQLRSTTGGPLDLMLHGDFHMWNVAFDKANSMKMFDYQVVCKGGSPACDLHYFLSQAVSPSSRRQEVTNWLRAYYDELTKTDGGNLSFDTLVEEFGKKSPIGLIFGMNFVLPRFIKDQDLFTKAKDSTDSKEKVELLDQCGGPLIWSVVQDLFEAVEEYDKLGAVDIMEGIIKAA